MSVNLSDLFSLIYQEVNISKGEPSMRLVVISSIFTLKISDVNKSCCFFDAVPIKDNDTEN